MLRKFSLITFWPSWPLWPLLIALLLPSASRADLVFLPESRHQQFTTYGLFFEEQSMLVMRDASRAWGSLGLATALLEKTDWAWKPQLIVHASANAGYYINPSSGSLATQTIDARAGLAVDFTISPELRAMIMWEHQSGHISDDVIDKQLIGPNLGNEVITARVIRDIDRQWRLGGSLRPVLGSDPGETHFGFEQFAEFFPWQASTDPHALSPFLAIGFEEYGRYALGLTFHAQAGFAAGSHFDQTHHAQFRFVAGYYNGADPRLKYFQFFDGRAEYGYLGIMLDI